MGEKKSPTFPGFQKDFMDYDIFFFFFFFFTTDM